MRQFHRKPFMQSKHGGFCARVADEAGNGDVGGQRGDFDNVAFAILEHFREDCQGLAMLLCDLFKTVW